jgi:hypothetical protein
MAKETWELPITRIEAIAEDVCAAPLAVIKRGSAIPERIPMIPQTNSKSMTANPPDDRIFTQLLQVTVVAESVPDLTTHTNAAESTV